MQARAHFLMLARHHRWATQRLKTSVDTLADEPYRRDVGLFFGSVHRTLDHLLLTTSEIWFARFQHGVSPALSLSQPLEADRARLFERLLDDADEWMHAIGGWDDARFDSTLHYRSTAGLDVSLPFAATLTHVFNHATHHRGQVTAALTALGAPCPELDLVLMLIEKQSPPQPPQPTSPKAACR